MDTAYDAKIGILSKGPTYFPSISQFFLIIIILFSSIFTFAKDGLYTEEDISIVAYKLFDYHVDKKEFNAQILRRMIKIYIDSFDPSKMYLLESEVTKYLNLRNRDIKKITKNIKKGDYSDFYQINKLFEKAIVRAKKNRSSFKRDLNTLSNRENISFVKETDFAKDRKALKQRQKDHFLTFFNAQKAKVNISSFARKKLVFDLYDRKISEGEKDFSSNQDKKIKTHNFVTYFLKSFSKSLDAHSYFFSSDEAREMRVNLEKRFEGVGVVLTETIDGVIVSDMIKNGPAADSKVIQKGDIIVKINNKNVEGFSFREVLNKMKEKKNGYLILGLKRQNRSKIIEVNLKSRPIEMKDDRLTYSYEKVDSGIIATLTLNSFYENSVGDSCEKDIKKAIEELRLEGNIKGIILDLRDNAGGFLSQAVKVAGIFISNGVVVMSKYSNDEVKYLRTIRGDAFYSGPLIILTSKMSASAAEIVAQALQDYGVALVVGDSRTFGKGSIQYQTVTNPNSEYFYKVTIGRYYTVSGKSTQINGVIADISVPSKYHPFSFGEKYLEYSLPSDRIDSAYNDTLNDLEPRLKKLFEKKYKPNLQKRVAYWQNMLPLLKQKSKSRIEQNSAYLEYISSKKDLDALRKNNPNIFKQIDAMQLIEAKSILKDMINLSKNKRF